MKRNLCIALVGMMYTGFLCGEAHDPAEGFWLSVDAKTGEIQSGWELYQSERVLYGKMLSAIGITESNKALKCRDHYRNFPVPGRVTQLPILGTPWIFGLQQESHGTWVDGKVINPGDGRIYTCKIVYHPGDGKKYKTECLEIRGEIGLGIGASQYWQRTTSEQAGALR
ncbi:MAG: DUF2147 domain-containing protein [Treponema sp.]|jgi:uncharacterized protein (DUF2147 family)|nr:DUF2147 domain-containing protein [Treponema sp.]